MDDKTRDMFEVEKQVYHTQWTNIRLHWEQTVSSVKHLSTLIVFAIIPLKFFNVTARGSESIGVASHDVVYIKLFLVTIIFILGLLTILNQYNHHKRSSEARKVVVAIEKSWGLYDQEGNFIFQDADTDYSYKKFAGGEKRITHSRIQFWFISMITIVGIAFVIFA